jgi:hypothetical protein
LWFILEADGPAITPCAIKDVAWNRAWGMMFLGDFLVFEGISDVEEEGKI